MTMYRGKDGGAMDEDGGLWGYTKEERVEPVPQPPKKKGEVTNAQAACLLVVFVASLGLMLFVCSGLLVKFGRWAFGGG